LIGSARGCGMPAQCAFGGHAAACHGLNVRGAEFDKDLTDRALNGKDSAATAGAITGHSKFGKGTYDPPMPPNSSWSAWGRNMAMV
jgi:hypothetical protein